MVRRLISMMLKAALFWSLWWLVGAVGVQLAWPGVLREFAARGVRAEAELADVTGFPGQFDMTFRDIAFANPRAGFLWSAPGLGLRARAWNPLHLTATWPTAQTIATPAGRVEMRARALETTIRIAPGPALRFGGFRATADAARFTSNRGLSTGIDRAELSFWPAPGGDDRFDLAIDAAGIEPTREFRLVFDRAHRLPQKIDRLDVDATLGFDGPWDRHTDWQRGPQPTEIVLRDFALDWGEVGLAATGSLAIDAAGIPEGEIALTVRNWREILALAVTAGLVPPENAEAVERALALADAATAEPGSLAVPVWFRRGQIALGPVPVGPAPVLRIRYRQ